MTTRLRLTAAQHAWLRAGLEQPGHLLPPAPSTAVLAACSGDDLVEPWAANPIDPAKVRWRLTPKALRLAGMDPAALGPDAMSPVPLIPRRTLNMEGL